MNTGKEKIILNCIKLSNYETIAQPDGFVASQAQCLFSVSFGKEFII